MDARKILMPSANMGTAAVNMFWKPNCGYLNKSLRNTPSIRHTHFNLYYNFASVISSMIRGGNEAVDPVILTDVFSACVP
jgi:hypothetical protein